MKRKIVFIVFVLMGLALTSCGHSFHCDSSCSCDRGITARIMEQLSELSDFAYVDWNKPDIGADMSAWQHPSMVAGFPMEEAQTMYLDCLNLKAWVHHVAVPLRSINAKVNKAIDALECGFDTLYVRFISQDYYLRLRQETFDATIPPLMDSLVAAFSE